MNALNTCGQSCRVGDCEFSRTMARRIAHDFNNVLAAINGYSEMLLLEEDLPEDVSAGLRAIQRAFQRGVQLTSQMLSSNRIQTDPSG